MSYMKKIIFALMCFLLFFVYTFKSAADDLKSIEAVSVEQLTVNPSNLDLESISGYEDSFSVLPSGVVKMDRFSGSVWLRVSIESLKNKSDDIYFRDGSDNILLLGSPFLSEVDYYFAGEKDDFMHRSPVVRSLGSSPGGIYSRFPALLLSGLPKDGYIYLNVRNTLPIHFKIYSMKVASFLSHSLKTTFVHVAFFCSLFVLILAFLFFYYMTNNKLYLVSAIRQVSIFLTLLFFCGNSQHIMGIQAQISGLIAWGAFSMTGIMTIVFYYFSNESDSENASFHLSCCRFVAVQAILSSLQLIFFYLGMYFWASGMSVLIIGLPILTDTLLVRANEEGRVGLSRPIYVLSRLFYHMGLTGIIISTLFPAEFGNIETVSMLCIILKSVILAYALTRETRFRLRNYSSLVIQRAHYKELSQIDPMTKLTNKSHMLMLLREHVHDSLMSGRPLSFIMLDIDFFKRFNDTFGHQEGDRALIFAAKVIRMCLRETDISARYGGEEFSVVLLGTSLERAIFIAERIRKTCEFNSKELGEKKVFTISLGLTVIQPGDTPETIIKRADTALYRAKQNGRNRTEVELGDNKSVDLAAYQKGPAATEVHD